MADAAVETHGGVSLRSCVSALNLNLIQFRATDTVRGNRG